MLNSFRKNQSIRTGIIWVVVILLAAYVLVGFGSAPPMAQGDTIAQLGSTKIKMRDAWIQMENVRNTFRSLDRETVDRFTTNQLISDGIILDSANKLDLKVSDSELRDYVIRSRTTSDGKYIGDEDWAYRIKNIYRVQVESFEDYMREHDLMVNKYRDLFYDSAYVSEDAIKNRFIENNQKVKLEMVVLNTFDVKTEVDLEKDGAVAKLMEQKPEAFKSGALRQVKFVSQNYRDFEADMEVSDEEAAAYYNENEERYVIKERVRASHVLIKTDSRSEDEALELARKVRKEIEDGLDFAEAAKKYSEDEGSKAANGDLGFFNRGRMVKPFEDASFAMAVDELSEPVKSQFGYHIIKKTGHEQETRRSLEEVKGAIVSTLKRTKAKGEAVELIKKVQSRITGGSSLEEAAKAENLEVLESPFFDNDRLSNMGDVLKTNFQARRAIFALAELEEYTDVLSLSSEAVLAQWTAKKEAEPLDPETDKVRVRKIAEDVAGVAFIETAFDKLKDEALKNPGKSLKDLKGKRDYLKDNHFKTTAWVDANTLPYEIRRDDLDFAEDIYALGDGQFLDSYATNQANRMALVRVIEKQEPDMTKLEDERYTLIQALRSEIGSQLFGEYMFHKREEYDPDGEIQARLANSLTVR